MASVKQQFAALSLALLILFAFGSQVMAECAHDAGPQVVESDCHDMVVGDCEHHFNADACVSAADCGDSGEILPSAERKWQPDGGEPGAALPTQLRPDWPKSQPTISSRSTSQLAPDGQGRFLRHCRFLE